MRTFTIAKPTALLTVALTASLFAKTQDSTALEQQLESKYSLTSINAEGTVVTQGVTLTLKRKGLTAGQTSTCTNAYKDGKISLASTSRGICGTAIISHFPISSIPGFGTTASTVQGAAPATRPFVAGEKVYVTRIQVKDAVIFSLVSDTVNNATYKAELKFQMPKGSIPDFAQSERMISEVFTVTAPAAAQTSQAAAPPRTSPPLRDIAPPPPPPATSTVSLGQTIDQVVAILGKPASVDDLGAKLVYNYPGEKVTFVDGKVADVQ